MPEDRVLRSTLKSSGSETAAAAMATNTIKDAEIYEKMSKNELDINDVMTMLLEIRNKQDGFHKQLDDLKAEMLTTMDVKIKKATEKIEQDVTNLKSQVENIQLAHGENSEPVDDVNRTVIVINLSEVDPLPLSERITDMLTQLECPENTVVQVKRLEGRYGKPGLVKVAFDTRQSKIEVLRAKSKLKDVQHYKKVWMRSSKTPVERVMEQNFKKMLDLVSEGKSYRVTGSGRIEEKQDNQEAAQGNSRGRGRGTSQGVSSRGRGGDNQGYRGRGGDNQGYRGRGGSSRGQDTQTRGRGRGESDDISGLSNF